MSLHWLLMTEWSKLLHQLNSISVLSKTQLNWCTFQDTTTLFQPGLLVDPKQSSLQETASVSFIGSSGEPTLKTDNWKHTCLYSGSRRREVAAAGPTSAPQPEKGRWKLQRRSILQNRDHSCICDKNMILKQRHL